MHGLDSSGLGHRNASFLELGSTVRSFDGALKLTASLSVPWWCCGICVFLEVASCGGSCGGPDGSSACGSAGSPGVPVMPVSP